MHSGILFSHKEECNDVICRKMELRIIMLSKTSQTQREVLPVFSHMWNLHLRNDMNTKGNQWYGEVERRGFWGVNMIKVQNMMKYNSGSH
jgi:hypothetical protein